VGADEDRASVRRLNGYSDALGVPRRLRLTAASPTNASPIAPTQPTLFADFPPDLAVLQPGAFLSQ